MCIVNAALVCITTGMENSKSSSSWFADFGREGSSPFSGLIPRLLFSVFICGGGEKSGLGTRLSF